MMVTFVMIGFELKVSEARWDLNIWAKALASVARFGPGAALIGYADVDGAPPP